MRAGHYLLALAMLAGAAGATSHGPTIYTTPLPEGGAELIQPGYTLRTPGKGWTMIGSLKPENGVVNGVEFNGVFAFSRGPQIWEMTLFVNVVRWPVDLTDVSDLAGYVRERSFLGQSRVAIPGERLSVETVTINGAPCAVSRSEYRKRYETGGPVVTAAEVHQICAHPEFPGFAVELRYEAARDEAEYAVAAQSLHFTPIPYRVREIRPGCTVGPMTQADGALWTTCKTNDYEARGKVLRIDPATNAVSASIDVGRGPTEVVAAGGYLWAGNLYDDTISRIDPKTNTVTATLGLSGGPINLMAAGGYVWARPSNEAPSSQTYVRIDPATAAIDKGLRLDGYLYAISAGRWLLMAPKAALSNDWLRVDGTNGEVMGTITLEGLPMHFDGRYLWLKRYEITDITILKRDMDAPEKPAGVVRRVDGEVLDVALWNGEFCALGLISVRCGRLDGALTREVPIEPYSPARLRVFAGSLWVEDWSGHAILRIDPK